MGTRAVTRAIVRNTTFPRGNTMNRRLIRSLLTAACAAAPLAALPAGPAQAQSVMRPANDIVLSIGRGQLVTVPGNMSDVFVAKDEVADVQVKSPRQLYVFGKAGGETTVYASNAAGAVIWSANVRVGSNIDSIDQMLALAMPEAKVGISTMGTNTFLLTGTVASPEDAAEAQRLVKAFVGEKGNVISRLKMATPLQISLQVRFAEVNRSLVREMGVNLQTRDLTGGIKFGFTRGRDFGTIGPLDTAALPQLDASSLYGFPAGTLKLPFDPSTGRFITGGTTYTMKQATNGLGTLGLAGKLAGLDISSALDLGERAGLVTTLSQPNLTALSGETAEFLAGGEYPIPISQSLGAVSIEYKKYGVSLAYTPTVLANGRISIRVRPEVSELSNEGAVTLNGYVVPALTIRRAETTVELGSGQSFMIAGLLSTNSRNTAEKTPGAADLPILGSLFRSTNFQRGETELVIVVTPYLVNPVNDGDIKLPTDGLNTPNELQRLFGNMQTDGKSGVERPKPTTAPNPDAPSGPAVGMVAPAPAPAAPSEGPRKQAKRGGSADAPTPGFNLK